MAQGAPGSRSFADPSNHPAGAAPWFFYLKPENENQLEGFVSVSWALGPVGPGGRSPIPQFFTSPNDERCLPLAVTRRNDRFLHPVWPD